MQQILCFSICPPDSDNDIETAGWKPNIKIFKDYKIVEKCYQLK
jgi:hypothetical protein